MPELELFLHVCSNPLVSSACFAVISGKTLQLYIPLHAKLSSVGGCFGTSARSPSKSFGPTSTTSKLLLHALLGPCVAGRLRGGHCKHILRHLTLCGTPRFR